MPTFKKILGSILLILSVVFFQISTGVSGNTIDIVPKAFLISAGVMLFSEGILLFYSSGVDSANGTLATIKNLKTGLKYTVISAVKKEEDNQEVCYLLLEAKSQTKAYELKKDIPDGLSPGKTIIKTADQKIVVI